MSFYQEARAEQRRFYASKKWQKCRDTYLSEHPCCERCARVGIAVAAEHVHHIKELDKDSVNDPLIAFNPENLEALCFECHQKEHHAAKEIDPNLYFDENGNVKHI